MKQLADALKKAILGNASENIAKALSSVRRPDRGKSPRVTVKYGYRRITVERRGRGRLVNHKRGCRSSLREDSLLSVQPQAFVVTTNAHHELEVYLNLASRMTLTGINQLRVADITSMHLHAEFVYLAVILDGFYSYWIPDTGENSIARLDLGKSWHQSWHQTRR